MPREAKKKVGEKDNANQKGKIGKVLYIPFLMKELRR
jgi:hypothetical protein